MGLRVGALQGDASSVALDGAEGAGTAAGLERSPSGGCMPWSPSGDAATSFVLGASTAAKARRRCVHVNVIVMVFSLGLSNATEEQQASCRFAGAYGELGWVGCSPLNLICCWQLSHLH
jgi:hypothetical protein